MTLAELLPRFLAERGASPAMQSEHHVSVRMFEQFLVEPTPVYKITRTHLNGYKSALMQAPANAIKRFPGLTLPQAIIANQKRATPFPTLQARTVSDKWLARLRWSSSAIATTRLITGNHCGGCSWRWRTRGRCGGSKSMR